MATTFLTFTNDALAKLNEVQLTSTDFTDARGIQIQVKNAVNQAIRYINQREFGWPFNAAEASQTLTAGVVKYSLPSVVKFCTKCVISNQRPNSAIEFEHTAKSKKETIKFDNNGVCDACRSSEEKKTKINWKDREKKLIELCNRYRKKDGSYDCLIPGSGGKDSFFQAHVLVNVYGQVR